jgi:hypothetical protein
MANLAGTKMALMVDKKISPDSMSKKPWNNKTKSGPVTKNQAGKMIFKGAIAALNGHVYEVHNEVSKANQFHRMTQAITGYVNRTMKYGKDMRYIMEHLEDVDFEELVPSEPEGTRRVAELMLQQQVNIFMKQKDFYENNKDA